MEAPSDYEAWREARHAAMPATEVQLLGTIVAAATGDCMVRWERIVAGEINEVHAAVAPRSAACGAASR